MKIVTRSPSVLIIRDSQAVTITAIIAVIIIVVGSGFVEPAIKLFVDFLITLGNLQIPSDMTLTVSMPFNPRIIFIGIVSMFLFPVVTTVIDKSSKTVTIIKKRFIFSKEQSYKFENIENISIIETLHGRWSESTPMYRLCMVLKDKHLINLGFILQYEKENFEDLGREINSFGGIQFGGDRSATHDELKDLSIFGRYHYSVSNFVTIVSITIIFTITAMILYLLGSGYWGNVPQ
jgi:hypothetical protein